MTKQEFNNKYKAFGIEADAKDVLNLVASNLSDIQIEIHSADADTLDAKLNALKSLIFDMTDILRVEQLKELRIMNVTELEKQVIKNITESEYMMEDEVSKMGGHPVWSWTATNEKKQLAGALGSLVKKGLCFAEISEGDETCGLTEKGAELAVEILKA